MNKFQGEVSTETLVDIIQFYILSQASAHITITHKKFSGEIWVSTGRVLHATTTNNFGIDAFYEMLTWETGTFKVSPNVLPEVESINKLWTELILEYYVLLDEGKIKNYALEPEAEQSSTGSTSRKPSSTYFKSIKDKFNTIMELDGVLAASIVDITTGMPIIQNSDKSSEFELYCAYMVEVVKSHKKFLNNLNIKDKIEDIVINLNNNYHIVTFVLKQDNLFIYVILDKEKSNLGMSRLVLMKLEEELEL